MSTQAPMPHPPAADWSHIQETVRMLELAVAHIEHAMHEGDVSIEALGASFTTMVDHVAAMDTASRRLPDGPDKAVLQDSGALVARRVDAAIVAFQFYDILSQRLSHVAKGLEALSVLVGNPSQLHAPQAWTALQDTIKSRYTIPADRAMFEAVLNGMSVADALQLSRTGGARPPEADIEFF